MAKENRPALQALLEEELEGAYETRIRTLSTGSSSVQIISQNYERLAFSVSNFGSYDVVLTPDSQAVSGSGFMLNSGGGFLSVNWHNDMLLPGLPWYAESSAGASSLFIIELVRYRR